MKKSQGIKRYKESIENVMKGREYESENKFGVRYRDEWKQVEMELTEAGKRKREDAVCLIEWPERGEGTLPEADVEISLAYLERGRHVVLKAFTDAGKQVATAE